MQGDPEFVILKYSAWLDAADFGDKILGAIVKHYLDPINDYEPESPDKYIVEKPVTGSFTDFVVESSASTANAVTASPAQSITRVSLKGNTEDKVHLQGKFVWMKRIPKYEKLWSRLKEDPDVKDRVPEWMSLFSIPKPVCLVTGIMVCEDVEISYEGLKEREWQGHIELPLGEIPLAAGVPATTGDAVNPEVKIEGHREKATVFKARSGQSKIFALELKRVTTKFLNKQELILKNKGPKVDAGRVLGDQEEEEEEEVTVDDLLLQDLDV
ncbi:hypothetical protein THARTR1_11237 [Trichoderma harzianum]|uniref:Uncharacterized protein n=1 Tax=Trichoderma harzianum TaxID=5544 RepID=A0A2K0T5D8_TRIHA|nr:hypothetical protein THARTR1_11237 [Trichoderma harzianum]